MKRIYILPIFYLLLCTACEKEDKHRNIVAIGDEITFTGRTITETLSRADTEYTSLPEEDIIIIAPGYGSGQNQRETYVVNPEETDGSLKPRTEEKYIKRSAVNMAFAAWTTPGLIIDIDKPEEGTVNFKEDLTNLIGAQVMESDKTVGKIALEFKHLVAKLSITVLDVTTSEEKQATGASITFPAIKETGRFTASLLEYPVVTPGVSGSELNMPLEDTGATTIFLPSLSKDDLMMYGTFSVKVGETDYVGTLNSLSTGALNAGDHVILKITIQDDRTALLQAVTLAPWDAYPNNYYNRPYPGIWGMEDLLNLSELINGDETEVNGYKIDDFYLEESGEKIIRLYTDITFDATTKFSPIGTAKSPFEGMIFDGNGYHIHKLNLDNPGENNQALFGVVKNATIRNVSLMNISIDGKDNVGALIGQSLGGLLVEHCSTSDGSVSGEKNVGGLIGANVADDVIRNCGIRLRSVSGVENVGGFIGENNGIVGNSFTILSHGLSCVDKNAGGFVGKNTTRIENCYSSAVFVNKPQGNSGAFVGESVGWDKINAENIYRCYWSSNAIDNTTCSKVIGNNTRTDSDNLEVRPTDTGEAFNSLGNITNLINTTAALRERLNGNVTSIGNSNYLRWATVVSYPLPVFSY